MNESIKDKFLKEHALNDDELDEVVGGKGDNIEYIAIRDVSCPLCGRIYLAAIYDLDTYEYTDITCENKYCSFYCAGPVHRNNLQSWRASF